VTEGSAASPSSLVLSDGREFRGISFGAERAAVGEVVFNTGMTGYTETLTDPSYRGQIVVLTYPLQGNYGIPPSGWESSRVQVEGLVVSRVARSPSHSRMEATLAEWLRAHDVPALCDVDTRAITRALRAHGTMRGELRTSGAATPAAGGVDMKRVAEIVTAPGVRRYDGGERRVLLIDTGAKESIVKSLQERELSVVRAAFTARWEGLLGEVDGVVLPNGPGDPADLMALVERIRPLLDGEKPLLGICLGHQLVALAAGATTYKLPYGHRSQNQPVLHVRTGRAYVTSQNHGYAVRSQSIPRGFVESFKNLNDGTNEGIAHETRPIMTAQFHPEAASGPHDTDHVFDEFARLLFGKAKAVP
jgi:carbamoyl-phosphate synthase small subunit